MKYINKLIYCLKQKQFYYNGDDTKNLPVQLGDRDLMLITFKKNKNVFVYVCATEIKEMGLKSDFFVDSTKELLCGTQISSNHSLELNTINYKKILNYLTNKML